MHVRALSVFVLLAIVLSGCSGQKPVYRAAVAMTDPRPVMMDGGVQGWRDGDLAFVFTFVGTADVFMAVRNNGPETAKIIWDDATIVLPDGSVSRAVHGQVRVANAHLPVPPTVIPSDADWAGVIIPVAQLEWNAVSRSYVLAPMYGAAESYHGKAIRLTVPVQYGQETEEYKFTFLISVAKAS